MSQPVAPVRHVLIEGNKSYHNITEDLSVPTEKAPSREWILAFTVAAAFLGLYVFAVCWTIWKGIGSWNLNRTINWGWDITNFVWWIGIGHAGTLISAILLLFRQRWRTGVNRAAEAMTIFAVICAGQFPLIHMGRLCLVFSSFPSQTPADRCGRTLTPTSGNWVIEKALINVQDSVRAGRTIAEPLANEPMIPSMVTQMIAVGEDSGSLEQMLNKISDFYDSEVQATTEALTSLIESLMIAVIDTVIGGMIIALYMPIFTIFDQIH